MFGFISKSAAAATLVLAGAAGTGWSADDLTVSPDGPEAVTVYYTQEEAVAKVFADADTVWAERWTPTQDEKGELEARLGWRVAEEFFVIFRALGDGKDRGYAVITEEQGRFKPITFIVKLSDRQEVDMVLIMVYRESRGDGVKRQRFLKQFRDKDASDHLQLNRDIVAVSGATMSSRAVAAGVRKVLAVVGSVYPPGENSP